jgi:Xaa-Pro dipeptidase
MSAPARSEIDTSAIFAGLSTTTGGDAPFSTAMFAEHRAKVVENMKTMYAAGKPGDKAIIYGGVDSVRGNSDHEPIFRQESNFFYMFGAKEPEFIGVLDLETGKSTLLIPKLPEVYAVWMGRIKTKKDFQEEYGVDEVAYHEEMSAVLAGTTRLFRCCGINTDSGRRFPSGEIPAGLPEGATVDSSQAFYHSIVEARVVKTAAELKLLRWLNALSSEAHLAVMRATRPGMKEHVMEAIFRFYAHVHGGARDTAYTPIAGSGLNSAVLHYGHAGAPNDRTIGAGEIILNDFGAERHCYASDITVSFPSDGTFTSDGKAIYEAVLEAWETVVKSLKPGVKYYDMQALSYRIILRHLLAMGVVKGDVEAMMEANVASVFMPHGVGHLMGLDTHDAGGVELGKEGDRDRRQGYRSVRLTRPLKAGMVLTVEPGCYFIDATLDAAFADPDVAKFLVKERVDGLRGIGGVRLEDNIIITESGYESMTRVPRSVEHVEAACRGEIASIQELPPPLKSEE